MRPRVGLNYFDHLFRITSTVYVKPSYNRCFNDSLALVSADLSMPDMHSACTTLWIRSVDTTGSDTVSSNRQPTVVYNEASMRRTTGQRSWANTFPGLLCG